MSDAKLPLRPNVCMLVFNREKRLFLGQRFNQPSVWQFPQGGVESHLSVEENVFKELEEELGVERALLRVVRRLAATNEYEWSEPPAYAVGKWRGQAQTFWLVEFLGIDTDIHLDRHTPEFSFWRWCTAKEVREMAEPRRVPGYENALVEFEGYITG